MVRDKPALSDAAIAHCLERVYGLTINAVLFLALGYDPNAAVYRIETPERTYFLKLTRNPVAPAALHIPRALIDHGIPHVLAPLRTLQHELWCTLDQFNLVLYPFIQGDNTMQHGLSDHQWITFGATLKAIHSSGIEAQFSGTIPTETFATPMIDQVRAMQQQIQRKPAELPVQQQFAAFWQQNADLIRHLTDRAEQLGALLQAEPHAVVLCHGDVHAANIMVDHTGDLYIVDWDAPRIAPRERDLLFIVGSTIARRVTAQEEARFFQGYGATTINWRALTYYRYERVLEDVYEGGRSVFFNPASSVAAKQADAQLVMALFQPDQIVQSALEADAQLDR